MAQHPEPDVLFSRLLTAGVSDMLKEWRKFNTSRGDMVIKDEARSTRKHPDMNPDIQESHGDGFVKKSR